jgi:beta-mannosidase
LDTFATVKFCDHIVGTPDNQFRQWFYDVSSVLSSCKSDPVLSINFGSVPRIINAINASSEVQREWRNLFPDASSQILSDGFGC